MGLRFIDDETNKDKSKGLPKHNKMVQVRPPGPHFHDDDVAIPPDAFIRSINDDEAKPIPHPTLAPIVDPVVNRNKLGASQDANQHFVKKPGAGKVPPNNNTPTFLTSQGTKQGTDGTEGTDAMQAWWSDNAARAGHEMRRIWRTQRLAELATGLTLAIAIQTSPGIVELQQVWRLGLLPRSMGSLEPAIVDALFKRLSINGLGRYTSGIYHLPGDVMARCEGR